jgi:hypothetical protein
MSDPTHFPSAVVRGVGLVPFVLASLIMQPLRSSSRLI